MISHTHNGTDSPKIKSVSGLYLGTDAMKTFNDETVAGVKTFSDIPLITSSPTADDEMARKAYADAMDIPSSEVVASDNLRDASDTAEETTNKNPLKRKEIKYNDVDATIRIKFDLQTYNGDEFGYGRIYLNDVATGTQRTTKSYSGEWTTFTEDLAVEKDDLIQLYIWTDPVPDKPDGVRCRNFRLYYIRKLTNIIPGTVNL
jgi:hypothetical protein